MSGTLAVISQSGHSLSFCDLTSGTLTSCLTNLIAEPHELCFDSKRNLLYISHAYRHRHFWAHGENGHEISVVDLSKSIPEVTDIISIKPSLGPHGLFLDSTNDILYVSFEESSDGDKKGGVLGLNLQTRKVIKRISSQTRSHWFTITPDSKKAYTCNKTAPFISILDLEKQEMVGKISIPGGCEEPAMSLDGRFAYFPTPGHSATASQDAKIVVIDTATDKIVREVKLDLGAQGIHVTSKGQIMLGLYQYEISSKTGKPAPVKGKLALYEQDGEDLKLVGQAETGVSLTIRSSPDGKIGVAANIFDDTLSVVDLESMRVIKTIDVESKKEGNQGTHLGAHGLAFIP
jgi:DNA-binding beta-propeller fold protein YncE